MAHQDFSEICPIFAEGVEKEMTAMIGLSITASTSCPVWVMSWGREVEILEIVAQDYVSTALGSSSISCSVGIYADQSLSTIFGSIVLGSADIGTKLFAEVSADLTTSLGFTSTDCIAFCIEHAAVFMPAGARLTPIVIRYKDK
jgi:hypothetical protein